MRISESVILRAVAGKHDLVGPAKDGKDCPQCYQKSAEPMLKVAAANPVCMGCVLKALGNQLPASAKRWKVGTVRTMLLSANRDEQLQALAAGEKFGSEKTFWGGRHITLFELSFDVSLLHARLELLLSPGDSYSDQLVRAAARWQLRNLLQYGVVAEEFYKIAPDALPSLIRAAVAALPLIAADHRAKLDWLNQWHACQEPELRELILQSLAGLGLDDFIDPKRKAMLDATAEFFMTNCRAGELKAIIRYVNSIADAGITGTIKEVLALKLATYFAESGARFYAQLPDEHRRLVDHLVWQTQLLTSEQLHRETGIVVIGKIKRSSYYSEVDLLKDYKALLTCQSYYSNTQYIELQEWARLLLKPHVPKPPQAKFSGAAVAPENSWVVPFSADIANAAPALEAAFFQGALARKKSGMPTLKALQQLGTIGKYREFFPDIAELQHTRGTMIAELLRQLPKPKTPRLQPEPCLRAWLDFIVKPGTTGSRCDFRIFLNHLRGCSKCPDDAADDYNVAIIKQVLCAMPADKWIKTADIFAYMLYNDLALIMPAYCNGAYILVPSEWGGNNRMPIEGYHDKLFVQPFIQALLLMLAAVGVVELALQAPCHPDQEIIGRPYLSAGDGITAVRTTALAQWYFHAAELDLFTSTTESRLCLDSRRLLIRLIGDNPVQTTILAQVAEPVGNGLYRVSAASFLRDCGRSTDIRRKIKALTCLLPDPLPPLWQRFFADLHARINPIEPVSYTAYKIGASPELTQLFLNDPKLNSLCLKAQAGHILVANDKSQQLRDRLRLLGYFSDKKS